MKHFILYLILIFLPHLCFGQSVNLTATNCPDHNAFLRDSNFHDIQTLVTYIEPNGTMMLNPNKLDSLEFIFNALGLQDSTTFELDCESESHLDTLKSFRRFQQYYKGIKVENGGYTMAYIRPQGGLNPCIYYEHLLIPYVKSGISSNTIPQIQKSSIDSILLIEDYIDAELLVSHNLINDCEFNLVWKVKYFKDSLLMTWLDAHNGEIIRTLSLSPFPINATLPTYGIQNLVNRVSGNTKILESPDQKIAVYDFGNLRPEYPINLSEWTSDKIPTTTGTEWTNEALPEVYQSFYSGSKVFDAFKNSLKIDFVTLKIASSTIDGAGMWFETNGINPYIHVGRLVGKSLALHDVIAHELGHAFLLKFIKYVGPMQSLHEGMADIFGTYIESTIQNETDWLMGDDEEDVGYDILRSLQYPFYNCYTEVKEFGVLQQHLRGQPLGHLYYLVSQGWFQNEITGLGEDKAIKILIDAFKILPPDSDYHELMEATFTTIADNYGACSLEFLTFARAWDRICVETNLPKVNGLVETCFYEIDGPTWVCEETDEVLFCVEDIGQNVEYIFTIVGPNSTSFTSFCGMLGNSQYGCDCLEITDFPKYPYYPQYLTILVHSSIAPTHVSQRVRLTLLDCFGDDPTCKEYFDIEDYAVNNTSENIQTTFFDYDLSQLSDFDLNVNNISDVGEVNSIHLYDILGRLIYSGTYLEYIEQKIDPFTFYIEVSFEKSGKIYGIKKIITTY